METIMKPFIMIYHGVSKVLSLPLKILGKTEDAVLEAHDQIQQQRANANNMVEQPKDVVQIDNDNFSGIVQRREVEAPKRTLYPFRYYVINAVGKKETGIFEAESMDDVVRFLQAEGYRIEKVEPKKSFDIELGGNGKIKPADLAFSLTQLSTYIKAGIPLVDSVRILAKQATKPNLRKSYERLVYDLLKGENLSEAMQNQGERYPKLLINMVKTAEMTGDLASILDDMADYYTSMEQTRKQMVSAMTYPAVVLIMAFCVLIFMLVYLVPQFVQMFESQDANLPWITLAVMNASNFVKANYIWIILAIVVVIGVYYYLFKNVKSFRITMQTFMMHVPVFGKIIIYNEVANFTKTFASLINHGVFITDSMEILSKLTDNEIYKGIINKTLNNLGKGESISSSFKGEWAFPIVAYEMLVTGENTGQLGLMMEKVASHYQALHKSMIDQVKSLIEPFMIIMLAGIVGVILLSIIVPMFSIYGEIQ